MAASTAAQAADPDGVEFLRGGGEMGARMRRMDWSSTGLGAPGNWPQSLRSAVGICINAHFPIAIYWGRELTLLYNDAWSPIPGAKHPHALGQPARAVWPEIWDAIDPLFQRVQRTSEGIWQRDQLLAMHRHGFTEECYFNFTFSPILGEDGAVAGIFNAVVETTFQVIEERRGRLLQELALRLANLRSSEQVCERAAATLQTALVDLPFALLYLTDDDGRARLVARSGVELPAALCPESFHPAASEVPWSVPAAGSHEARVVHGLARHEGGAVRGAYWPEPIQEAVVISLGSVQDQVPLGFFVLGVSPRRPLDGAYRNWLDRIAAQVGAALADARLFEQERERAEALAELDRAKTVFFSNVSHELRTPLTLMLGPIEDAVTHPATPPQVRGQLELAHRNSLRLLKLVNSLLDFSRIEAGRMTAAFAPTDLAALTQDLASTFRSAIERAGLRFEVQCAALEEPVYLDREMWEKIVLNLLSNAFKFTLQGGISVRTGREGARALLEVSDTGVGIPPQELPRLFERFHRVENTRARTHEGSGIGLALVQELVKLHGGTVEVTSQVDRGTTLRIWLPLGHAHLPAARLAGARSPAATPGARLFVQEALRWLREPEADRPAVAAAATEDAATVPHPHLRSTAGARIVVADDNADMRGYVRDLLAPFYEVKCVADGEEALQALHRAPADLVIADVMMPRLDGFALLKVTRSDAALRRIPFIMLSARAGEEARSEGLEAGADDYLVKPFSARELLARVGSTLTLARERRDHEQRLQTLLNASPAALALLSAVRDEGGQVVDFRCAYLNQKAEELIFAPLGLTSGAILGQCIGAALPGTWETPGLFACLLRAMDSGSTQTLEVRARSPQINGDFLNLATPFADGVLVWFIEITAQKQVEELLREADRRKNEFLAMLAHELRNPLAPISNASEVLALTLPPEAAARAPIAMIQRQVSHLTRLVDDLLDVARITEGRIQLKRRTVEIGEIVTHAVETLGPQLRDKRHRMSITASYEPMYVNGDFDRLVQCVCNVLGNAIKYTDAGGDIRLQTRTEGDLAVIEVSDTGAGIAADLLPRIFELFVQSDRTLDRAQGGLGIGLSVVKRLVEMHGGQVTAHSDGAGRGSTFRISLPRVARPAAANTGALAQRVVPQKILIVDDNQDAANSLAMLLGIDGHETRIAYSAAEALEQARSFRPDTALLDIGLPEVDGYALAQQLRADPALRGVRLVALTGYGQAGDQQRAQAAGFACHLLKPVDLAALERAIGAVARSGA